MPDSLFADRNLDHNFFFLNLQNPLFFTTKLSFFAKLYHSAQKISSNYIIVPYIVKKYGKSLKLFDESINFATQIISIKL